MKPETFETSVDKLSALVLSQMPSINEKMALDATALIKDRIVNTGIDAKGNSLGKYSEHELPAFFFKDKALNGGGVKLYDDVTSGKKKKGVVKKGISYKEWREANQRPTDHVTLSFSGTTMKDIGVVKSIQAGTKVITSVGSKNTKTRENGDSTETIVDEYLGPKYGNFLEPNQHELDIMENILINNIEKLLNDSFR